MDGKAPGAAYRGEHLYMKTCDLLRHLLLCLLLYLVTGDHEFSCHLWQFFLEMSRFFLLFFTIKDLAVSHNLIIDAVLV